MMVGPKLLNTDIGTSMEGSFQRAKKTKVKVIVVDQEAKIPDLVANIVTMMDDLKQLKIDPEMSKEGSYLRKKAVKTRVKVEALLAKINTRDRCLVANIVAMMEDQKQLNEGLVMNMVGSYQRMKKTKAKI